MITLISTWSWLKKSRVTASQPQKVMFSDQKNGKQGGKRALQNSRLTTLWSVNLVFLSLNADLRGATTAADASTTVQVTSRSLTTDRNADPARLPLELVKVHRPAERLQSKSNQTDTM